MAGKLYLGSEEVMPVLTVGVSSPVKSVNGKTGNVVLNANDVHALPDTTVIPTVNNGTLTIQRNGSNVATFTANQSGNTTANISVPSVYNSTITFTQGGVSKGSITLNQSENETIALDAGGGGDPLPSQTGQSGKFLTTNGTSPSWKSIEFSDISGSSDVDVVAANISDVNTVADNISSVSSVGDNITNVNTVAGVSSDVTTVATNISDVTNVSIHMSDIIGAVTSSENAEKWAEGTDADVSPLGGTHSSKGWASISESYAISAQNYAVSANSSSELASNYASSAASSAAAASGYATDALNNSQKLMKSINPALCWSRTYTDYDMEKKYQFVTCNSNGSYVPTIDSTVYTTEEDIQGDGYVYTSSYGSLIIIGEKGWFSQHNGVIKPLGRHGESLKTTTVYKVMTQDSGYTAPVAFLNENKQLWQSIYFNASGSQTNSPGSNITSGWTMAYYPPYNNSEGVYGFGIKDNKLYTIINNTSTVFPIYSNYTATLLDESGIWTYASNTYKSGTGCVGIGIKDGKLYTMTNSSVTLLDDTLTWTADMFIGKVVNPRTDFSNTAANAYRIYVINNGHLYNISSSGITAINNNITFVQNSYRYAITNDGKLYSVSYNTSSQTFILYQQGTDTDWNCVRFFPSVGIYFAIKGGNLVYQSGSGIVAATSSGDYVGITGGLGYNDAINTLVIWKQTPVLKTEYAYTTPTSTVGDNLYGSTSLANPKTITAIDSSGVTAGGYIYTRDSSKDTYFVGRPDTFVSTALTTGDLVDALSS